MSIRRRTRGLFLNQLLVLSLLLAWQPAQAAAPLVPFKAWYQASFDLGVGLEGTAVRVLQQLAPEDWQLSFKASALFADFRQLTRLQSTPSGLRPLEYQRRRSILGREETHRLEYQWRSGEVKRSGSAEPAPLEADALDSLGLQLQLWRDLDEGHRLLEYRLVDEDGSEIQRYRLLDISPLTTPAGTFAAYRVERVREPDASRQTLIWLAVDHPYLILKLRQIKDDKRYDIELSRFRYPARESPAGQG